MFTHLLFQINDGQVPVKRPEKIAIRRGKTDDYLIMISGDVSSSPKCHTLENRPQKTTVRN